jgi:glycosyltransferase involved in cell wall biosynthesis
VFLTGIPRVRYSDPWSHGYEQRLEALRAGNPRIAYYYPRPDTSTFRYRVYNMIEALPKIDPQASAAWFTADDDMLAIQALDFADMVVICRSLYTAQIASLVARARALRIPVLFDVDDLVVDPSYTHLIMETLDQAVTEEGLKEWFGLISRLQATLRLCDGVVTTNRFLADHIRAVHNVPTFVVPNFLNRDQIHLSNRLVAAKEASGYARDGYLHLGYFSGTPTHNRDFAIIEPALIKLLEEDDRIRLRVVGFLDADRLRARNDRVEFVPLTDFLNLQRLMAEVEINLVPLQDNVFTNCKSELKYFEAAAVGTVTVASPTIPFRGAIRHGQNGYLAFAQDWYAVLRQAIDALADLPRLARTAASDALNRFTPEAQTDVLRDALATVAASRRRP